MGSLPDSKYIIQTDGYWFVEAHDVDSSKGYITVSAKGIANGLSNEPNDGADFGPDTYNPNYSGSGIPYTQTSGIQEAGNYASEMDIGDIFISAGIYNLYEPIQFTNGLHIRGEGIWYPFSNGNITEIPDNITVLRAMSSFSAGYMIQMYNSGIFIDNITLDLNGMSINGIYAYSSSTYPLASQQIYSKLLNVMGINNISGYYYFTETNTWNNIFDKCIFTGSGGSIQITNNGSDVWILNVQDYAGGGMNLTGEFYYIFGGIQQLVTFNGGTAFLDFCNWTNNFTNTDILLEGTISQLIISNSVIYIQSSYVINFNGYTIDSLSLINNQFLDEYNYNPSTIFSSLSAYNRFNISGNILVSTTITLPTLDGNPFSLAELEDAYHYALDYAPPSTPSVPASGTAQSNANPYPVNVYLYGGTVTVIDYTPAGGSATQVGTSGPATVRLNPGDSITLTYSAAPTWNWVAV